jgi:hypothetical protein
MSCPVRLRKATLPPSATTTAGGTTRKSFSLGRADACDPGAGARQARPPGSGLRPCAPAAGGNLPVVRAGGSRQSRPAFLPPGVRGAAYTRVRLSLVDRAALPDRIARRQVRRRHDLHRDGGFGPVSRGDPDDGERPAGPVRWEATAARRHGLAGPRLRSSRRRSCQAHHGARRARALRRADVPRRSRTGLSSLAARSRRQEPLGERLRLRAVRPDRHRGRRTDRPNRDDEQLRGEPGGGPTLGAERLGLAGQRLRRRRAGTARVVCHDRHPDHPHSDEGRRTAHRPDRALVRQPGPPG